MCSKISISFDHRFHKIDSMIKLNNVEQDMIRKPNQFGNPSYSALQAQDNNSAFC